MAIEIRPIRIDDAPRFREALQSVAEERRFILTLEAPPLERTLEFVREVIEKGYPQFVALDGERLVGWADFIPPEKESLRHAASLGMAVVKEYRGQGIGQALLTAVTEAALAFGFTRLELEVFANNISAIGLYEKHGFEVEGLKRKARFVDGEYYDIQVMARLVD